MAKENTISTLNKLPKEKMYTSNLAWLKSRFHFSFADYVNHDNMSFGVLRVLNDDIIHPQGGFPTHPHKNMEIISYIVEGEITHEDSMGNAETLKRGEVQYMSAGTGIKHSEFNMSQKRDLRLLQMWIIPPKNDTEPLYGSHHYTKEERKNKLLNIVSSQEGNSKVKIHQDINIYVSELDANMHLEYTIAQGRKVYFVQIEGDALINKVELNAGDALELTSQDQLDIYALSNSHFLLIDMA
jgi:redox-sensitive bicupin YhaK (pirin superfamily)